MILLNYFVNLIFDSHFRCDKHLICFNFAHNVAEQALIYVIDEVYQNVQ